MTIIQNRGQILANRLDLSKFLVHLTREGVVPSGNLNSQKNGCPAKTMQAISPEDSLAKILREKLLLPKNTLGSFRFHVPMQKQDGTTTRPKSKVKSEWLKAVCFTETPLEFVKIQFQKILGRDLQFSPYGLVFNESTVRKSGGNPLFYFESTGASRSALDRLSVSELCTEFAKSLALYEAFGAPLYSRSVKEIDFRWEREWRIVGTFHFEYSDLVCILCPESKFQLFDELTNSSVKLLDPNWDNGRLSAI